MDVKKKIQIIIKRQEKTGATSYEETFEVPYKKGLNVISVLMEIRRNPVNAKGENTTPPQWEMNCLEEVCGACSMNINNKPRQACSALIDTLEQPIHLAPMGTFPVIKDLIVNRSGMFNSLKKIKAWIPIDGTYDLGEGPRMPEVRRQWAYELSKCMTCGVCLEACPNVNDKTTFMGPFAFGQVELKNAHPTGKMNKAERLQSFMGEGGVARMWQFTKLCSIMSKRDSPNDFYSRNKPSGNNSSI